MGERRNHPISPIPAPALRRNCRVSGFDQVFGHPYRIDTLPGGYLVSDGYLTIPTRTAVEEEMGKSGVREGEENGKNENKGERGGR